MPERFDRSGAGPIDRSPQARQETMLVSMATFVSRRGGCCPRGLRV
jgi:hypothetical protein